MKNAAIHAVEVTKFLISSKITEITAVHKFRLSVDIWICNIDTRVLQLQLWIQLLKIYNVTFSFGAMYIHIHYFYGNEMKSTSYCLCKLASPRLAQRPYQSSLVNWFRSSLFLSLSLSFSLVLFCLHCVCFSSPFVNWFLIGWCMYCNAKNIEWPNIESVCRSVGCLVLATVDNGNENR